MTSVSKIVWGGELVDASSSPNDIEIWACSLSMLNGTDASTALPYVASAVQAFHQRATSHISNLCLLSYVKVYDIDVTTGHSISDPTPAQYYSGTGRFPGGGSSGSMPTFVSTRVSLDDGTRARRHRGGFYIPRPSMLANNQGRWGSTDVADILGSAHTFITAVNAAAGTNVVGIYSKLDESVHPVTRIRVGDVPDVIRRRKNAEREAYQTVAV